MKLASYNVENLFQRARALDQASWEDGRQALQWQAELNRILGKTTYSSADKAKILDLVKELRRRLLRDPAAKSGASPAPAEKRRCRSRREWPE